MSILCLCVCLIGLLEEETTQKLALNTKLRGAEEKLAQLQEQLEEEEEARMLLEKQVQQLNTQLAEMKRREQDATEAVDQLEDAKKRQNKVKNLTRTPLTG